VNRTLLALSLVCLAAGAACGPVYDVSDLVNDEHVRESLRIQTRLSPPLSSVVYVTGSRIRALAVTEVLGISLTLSAVLAVERRRRDRRPERPARVADTTFQPA